MLFSLLFLCRILFHLSFKYLMSDLLQHRALRIPWQLPVTSYFAPLQGPSLCWEYTLIFLILWPLPTLTPAYLLKIHIHATCSHSTALCYTTLLWAPVGAVRLPLSNIWCVTVLGCLILFPHKFMSSWRGQTVSFCHQWGALPRTCGFECMLNECSNSVSLVQNV